MRPPVPIARPPRVVRAERRSGAEIVEDAVEMNPLLKTMMVEVADRVVTPEPNGVNG